MIDQIAAGMAWLADQAAEHLAESIVYTRGVNSVTLQATRGRTGVDVAGEDGHYLRVERSDFSFAAADLVLGGLHALPRRGDRIAATRAGTAQQLEVVPLPGEDVYRWNDQHGISLRVFTQEAGADE